MNFVYLIQGRASQLLKYASLRMQGVRLVTLSYDYPISAPSVHWEAHLFRPNTTWAEGRNILLEHALALGLPVDTYYSFMDDDILIESGSILDFHRQILLHKPLMAVPLMDVIESSCRYSPWRSIEVPIAFDQCYQVFHGSLISDPDILPYETSLDHASWWCSCEINQFMLMRRHRRRLLQFNTIRCRNDHHAAELMEDVDSSSSYQGGFGADEARLVCELIEARHGKQKSYLMSPFDSARNLHAHPRQFLCALFLFFQRPSRRAFVRTYAYLYLLKNTLSDWLCGRVVWG